MVGPDIIGPQLDEDEIWEALCHFLLFFLKESQVFSLCAAAFSEVQNFGPDPFFLDNSSQMERVADFRETVSGTKDDIALGCGRRTRNQQARKEDKYPGSPAERNVSAHFIFSLFLKFGIREEERSA
jgi:hypothetical protein